MSEREPGYRYPRELVDKAADLIARDAGGYDEARWRDDPRNTAQAVFDLAESRAADLEAGIRERIKGWSTGADRAGSLGDFGRAASYGPFIDSLRDLLGDDD